MRKTGRVERDVRKREEEEEEGAGDTEEGRSRGRFEKMERKTEGNRSGKGGLDLKGERMNER